MAVWSLTSRLAWVGRSAWTAIEIGLIIGVDNMAIEEYSDTILNIPSEYIPALIVLYFAIGIVWTYFKGRAKFNAQDKDAARLNGGALTYGVNYLELNISVAIVTVLAGLILMGGAVGQGYVVLDSWIDVIAVGIVIGVICAVGSDYFLRYFGLESVRDAAKADEARAEFAAKTETAQTETKKDNEASVDAGVVVVKQD